MHAASLAYHRQSTPAQWLSQPWAFTTVGRAQPSPSYLPAATEPMHPAPRKPAPARRKRCSHEGCSNRRVGGSTSCCKKHGGGARCQFPDCTSPAIAGGKFSRKRCQHHGGSKRCSVDSCESGARSRGMCKTHGGGPRCVFPACLRAAQGGFDMCCAHGGGSKCGIDGCSSNTMSWRLKRCRSHTGWSLHPICAPDGTPAHP